MAVVIQLHVLCIGHGGVIFKDTASLDIKMMVHLFWYKKLGSGHRTKSFLTQNETFRILVLKVPYLISYFLNA